MTRPFKTSRQEMADRMCRRLAARYAPDQLHALLAEFAAAAPNLASAELTNMEELRRCTERCLDELASKFRPVAYRAAAMVVPPMLGMAFGGRFENHVRFLGAVDQLEALFRGGSVVLACTHSSNLDGFVVGAALHRLGLPACAYPAGKHLYRNRWVGRVISSLGGYCLDRAQAARLYKELVVEYSALLIEEDCHSLVFPSGTRSRSGKVESKLKLGLLGSTLRAQRYRLQRGIAAPVYIVPVTINHLVVPEAQLLIQYELEGRQKERVVGDEMRNQGSPGSFAKRVLGFEEHMSLCFGEALSPIGEAKGQPLVLDAEPSPGDMQHTRRLGTSIARAFLSGTRFYSTHVVARALYDLEGTTAHTSIDETMVLAAIDSAKQLLMRDASQGSLMDSCVAATPRHLLQEATRSWNRCHQAGVLRCDAGKVSVLSPALLLYYQNRSAHISN